MAKPQEGENTESAGDHIIDPITTSSNVDSAKLAATFAIDVGIIVNSSGDLDPSILSNTSSPSISIPNGHVTHTPSDDTSSNACNSPTADGQGKRRRARKVSICERSIQRVGHGSSLAK